MKTILVETFTPIDCPINVLPKFQAAYKADANKLEIDYNPNDVNVHADLLARMAVYNMGGTQQPRYMGKYGSHGSIWADSVNGGVQNWQAGTDAKIAEMQIENGFELSATAKETNGVMKLTVTGKAPKQTKCNVVVLLVDGKTFKQTLISKTVTVGKIAKTISLKGTVAFPNCKAIVLLQSLTPVDNTEWGLAEKEIFAVTLVKN